MVDNHYYTRKLEEPYVVVIIHVGCGCVTCVLIAQNRKVAMMRETHCICVPFIHLGRK